MKRPGLKLDVAAVGNFFFAHGEKIVVAFVALGGLGLVWAAVDAARFKSVQQGQAPKDIETLAASVRQHINAASRPPEDDTRRAGQLAEAIDPWRPPLKPTAAPQIAPFNRPLYRELAKRSKPEVFPLEDVRAVSGIAVVAEQAAQNTPPKLVPYVVVTGLIPTTKQKQEFARRFGGTSHRDEKTDRPHWDVYRVEKMQVGPDGSGTWTAVDARRPAERAPGETAGGTGAADVPPAFMLAGDETEYPYVAPLPPRQDAPWGSAAFHPWFLPKLRQGFEQNRSIDGERPAVAVDPAALAKAPLDFLNRVGTLATARFVGDPERHAGLVAQGVKAGTPEVTFAVGAVGDTSEPVFVVSDRWARALSLAGGLPTDTACRLRFRVEKIGNTPAVRILGFAPIGPDGKVEDERVDPAPAPLQMAPAAGQPVAGGGETDEAKGERAEYRLFRFVDLQVKPGQRYRYRVRFALRNPNHAVDKQHLADPALAKEPLLPSAPSNETAAVVVPEPTALLVRTLKKPDLKRMKSGAVEILVLAAGEQGDGYALRSLVTEPGGLANVDSKLNKPGDARTRGDDIATERVLVDVRGRQEDRAEQAKSAGVPEVLEMLFFRPDGVCEIVSAADSQDRYDQYAATLPAEDRRGKGPTNPDADAANPFNIPFPGTPKP